MMRRGTAENPLFLAKEVAEIIEHSNPTAMLQGVDEDEKVNGRTKDSLGRDNSAVFLTENGLYEVLMQSRKPIAKTFKKGIKVILQDVRKHGMYMNRDLLARSLENPDFVIGLLTEYKNEKEKSRMLEEKNQELLPKARYTEEVLQSDNTYTLTHVAKDLGMRSVHELTANLEKMKIMFRQSNSWLPFADYADKGYFVTRTATFDKTVGKGTSMYFVVTEKGRMWLHETFGVLAI